MSATPPGPPFDVAAHIGTAGERATLEAFLDDQREAVVRKIRGVSEEDARRRLVPSMTTLGGILKHLRWAEMNWFQRVLACRPAGELPPVPKSADDPDGDFRLAPEDTVEQLIATYAEECARSRATAAGHTLEATGPHRRLGTVSVRWIYAT